MRELGFPDLENSDWSGIFTSAEAPSYVISRLNCSINKMLAGANVRKQLEGLGYMVSLRNKTPENVDELVLQESRQWNRLLH
ncbi:tripartite tricarboxylate transporter substrate-binding protein [Bordetella sp. LUAb4]|uniref:tripartite tricarboxylate transporter substrate-binding protein n=1 Tax=Bordetella sp. LUAb4 TaxID=2843195 RepID=UPI001E62D201|nr:tripartite tricarboxylate transporter substrate-binding protein [Bordetella sp. LUAb4]